MSFQKMKLPAKSLKMIQRPEVVGESDQDKAARLKKNMNRLARKRRAEHHREAMRRYRADLKEHEVELARRQLEDEADRDRAANAQIQHNANQDREQARQGISRNLDPEFKSQATKCILLHIRTLWPWKMLSLPSLILPTRIHRQGEAGAGARSCLLRSSGVKVLLLRGRNRHGRACVLCYVRAGQR